MVSPLSLGRVPLELFFDPLLLLFHYPPRSSGALLAGTLFLWYCADRFASGAPTWRLPVSGQAAGQVAGASWEAQEVVAEGVGRRVRWVSGSGPNRRRIRLNRKTPAHLAGLVVQSRPRVWKRLCPVGHYSDSITDRKRRRYDQDDGGHVPARVRIGLG